MQEENIITVVKTGDKTFAIQHEDGSLESVVNTTDWARVDAKTEEELHADALSDPDNPPLTEEELNAEWVRG
jgi:hypothetical protein